MSIISQVTRIATTRLKKRTCNLCTLRIEPGEAYVTTVVADDGLQRLNEHRQCFLEADRLMEAHQYWYNEDGWSYAALHELVATNDTEDIGPDWLVWYWAKRTAEEAQQPKDCALLTVRDVATFHEVIMVGPYKFTSTDRSRYQFKCYDPDAPGILRGATLWRTGDTLYEMVGGSLTSGGIASTPKLAVCAFLACVGEKVAVARTKVKQEAEDELYVLERRWGEVVATIAKVNEVVATIAKVNQHKEQQ